MYQLLLDSSNKYLTVALAKDNKLIDVIFYEAWQRQSEMMVVEMDNIFKRNTYPCRYFKPVLQIPEKYLKSLYKESENCYNKNKQKCAIKRKKEEERCTNASVKTKFYRF